MIAAVHHATQEAMDNGWATTCGRFITTYVDRCCFDWSEVTCKWCRRLGRAWGSIAPSPANHDTKEKP